MSRPRSNTPRCPDCGGPTTKNGNRRGSEIKRYQCLGEVSDTLCASRPRRFTENTKDVPRDAGAPVATPTKDALSEDTHVFLFTYAQNATPVMEGFWAALNACRLHRGADLNVIKGRYRNPTVRGRCLGDLSGSSSLTKQEQRDEWWDEVTLPYHWDKRADICPAITILGDVRVQPTGQRPLTGLDSVTGGKSGILGHPKLEMRVIPTPQNALPKQMQTTGACTVPNYSDSKAGKKGEFHHTIGAVIVEVRGDAFHMRQINALRDGSFIDLDTEYLPDGTHRPAGRALALCMGDWHSGMTDPQVIDAKFGDVDSICAVLKPEKLFWEDLLDQYARNHHHMDNPFSAKAKQANPDADKDSLYNEVSAAFWELQYFTNEAARVADAPVESIVKASNHDEALTRYIKERNWKNDPINMEFYLETALRMVQGTTMEKVGTKHPEALHVWAEEFLEEDDPIIFLGRRDSFMVGDIECSFHGDIGLNGARGSITGFSKIGVKTVIAHCHTPGIVDGCYQVGTSTYLDLEYNRGPSSWMNTDCIIYANGKRALITTIDGKWRHE